MPRSFRNSTFIHDTWRRSTADRRHLAPQARVALRAIERELAMRILYCLDRYLSSRNGDVKKLKPPRTGLRLSCGNYRVFFDFTAEYTIEITGVWNRNEAYR